MFDVLRRWDNVDKKKYVKSSAFRGYLCSQLKVNDRTHFLFFQVLFWHETSALHISGITWSFIWNWGKACLRAIFLLTLVLLDMFILTMDWILFLLALNNYFELIFLWRDAYIHRTSCHFFIGPYWCQLIST